MKNSIILKFISILVGIVSYTQVFSQTNSNIDYKFESSIKKSDLTEEEKTAYLVNLCKEVENTYEVIIADTRLGISLTSDVCEIVKKERKKSETVFIKYNEYVTIKIYSEDEINRIKK